MNQISAAELTAWLCGSEAQRRQGLKRIYDDAEVRRKLAQWVQEHGGSKEEAEEVFQDALVIFDRNVRLGKFEGTGTWQGYFFGIARHAWLERCRRRKLPVTELLPAHLTEEAESFEHRFMEEERKTILRQALEAMGGRCKHILALYKISISYEEIAQQLGMSSADMAKKECYRCRQRFRNFLLQHPDLLDELKDDATNA